MKVFLCYSGVMITLFVAFTLYVFYKAKSEQPGDATLDMAFLGGIVLIAALVDGYAVLTLWRKFVEHDATIPTYGWILSGMVLSGSIVSVLQYAYDVYSQSKN